MSSHDGITGKSLNRFPAIRNLWPLIPVSLVATLLYFEGLFRNKSIIYGDAIIHGYPVLSYHKAVLEGHASLLWTNLIYGGHPLHAEGQFSFFSPLNTAVAYLLPPELGQNVYHWLCLILTGLGMIALCRRLGLSNVATAFASLAVTFSSYWLGVQPNLTIAGSLALIPLALWSFEKWLANPSQYLALAIIMAVMLFSGYPQTLHGTAIYMAVSLVSIFITAESRKTTVQHWKAYIGYGLAAVIICIGISAVQFVPTLELVNLSHRKLGIELFYSFPSSIFRGLLSQPIVANPQKPYLTILGSLLVCALASAVILYKPGARTAGHLVAAFFLFNLGMGPSSPIYSALIYSGIPLGLEYFRHCSIYFSMATIGICLIAAASIDNFQRIDFRKTGAKLKLVCLLFFWATVLTMFSMPDTPPLQYIVAAVALVSGILFVLFSIREYLGPLVVLLLIVEILIVKSQMLVFHDNDLLKAPPSVTLIKKENDYQNYKIYDFSLVRITGWVNPGSPGIDKAVLRVLDSMAGSSNLLWNVASFEGEHALPLARRMLIKNEIKDEIIIKSLGRSGLRLIDYLGIKYIVVDSYKVGESLQPVYQKDKNKVKFMRNTAALPRFQTFTDYQWVESAEEAAAIIGTLKNKVLVLEDSRDIADFSNFPEPEPDYKDSSNGINFVTEEANSTYYRFSITAQNPGFFFIADANYPGWKAKIDGKPTQVFSAQVLGKAVMLPEGKHILEVYFQSDSFMLGLTISITTLLFVTALLLHKWRHNHLVSSQQILHL